MPYDMEFAKKIRIVGLLLYGCCFLLVIAHWFLVGVLSRKDYNDEILIPFFLCIAAVAYCFREALKIRCPKCSARFFSKTSRIYSVNVAASQCRHCGLPLYR